MIEQVTTHIHDSIHADKCGTMLIFTHRGATICKMPHVAFPTLELDLFGIYLLFHFESNDQEVSL